MINLPTKDKNGKSFLTYSQIALFLKNKKDYTKQYIIKEPFFQNKYIKFGLKVGNAIEKNDYSLFTKDEKSILESVKRLDLFEKKCFLDFDDFYITGRIDSCTFDLTEIIDYKTGGDNKEIQYTLPEYVQLPYYALSIRQQEQIHVKTASVIFIKRTKELKIANDPPLIIPIDISEQRLKQVYYDTIKIAKEIELFYENYLHNQI